MPVDLAAKYTGAASAISASEDLGKLVRAKDGLTYMVDKSGHAWRLSAVPTAPKMRGGVGEEAGSTSQPELATTGNVQPRPPSADPTADTATSHASSTATLVATGNAPGNSTGNTSGNSTGNTSGNATGNTSGNATGNTSGNAANTATGTSPAALITKFEQASQEELQDIQDDTSMVVRDAIMENAVEAMQAVARETLNTLPIGSAATAVDIIRKMCKMVMDMPHTAHPATVIDKARRIAKGTKSAPPPVPDTAPRHLSNIVWATIEDPSTALLIVKDEQTGNETARPLSREEWNRPLSWLKHATIKHPFAYALPDDRKGQRDYCARVEKLVPLDSRSTPSLRDLLDLIYNMTLHYKGGDGVRLTTKECAPKVWAAHLHYMLSFAGLREEGGNTFVVRCKSVEQPPIYKDVVDLASYNNDIVSVLTESDDATSIVSSESGTLISLDD